MPRSSHWLWKLLTLLVTVSWSALVLGDRAVLAATTVVGLALMMVMIAGLYQHAFGWPRLPTWWWRIAGLPFAAWVIVHGGRQLGWHIAMLTTGIHPSYSTGWILMYAAVNLFALAAFPIPLVRLGQWQPLIERVRPRRAPTASTL